MRSDAPLRRRHRLVVGGVLIACLSGALGAVSVASAAESVSNPSMQTTQLIIKLATEEHVPIVTRVEETPPAIVVEFPTTQVAGTIPERSVIHRGVLEEITASFTEAMEPSQIRSIVALKFVLSAPYAHRVFSEPGRIIIEIDHPAHVQSETFAIALAGGTIIPRATRRPISDRFRAMQEALRRASPVPIRWRAVSSMPPLGSEPKARRVPTAGREAVSPPPAQRVVSPATTPPATPTAPRRASSAWLVVAAAILGLGAVWLVGTKRFGWSRRLGLERPQGAGSSSLSLIDQLVWRAFERQGYQLLRTTTLPELSGSLRVLVKENAQIGVLCLGDGTFLEKQTVDQFARHLEEASLKQGILVAPCAFTVPAQRAAKAYRVTLIGREQLMELLSAGATSEYYARELQKLQTRVGEAEETLRQYAEELDTIRRQRNDASWLLGEERAKSSKLEEQLTELAQQHRSQQTEAGRWQQESQTFRKQWEESQWYLGEAQTRLRHFETQMTSLKTSFEEAERRCGELTASLQEAQRQRDEANWYLGETRAAHADFNQRVEAFEAQLAQAAADAEALRRALADEQQRLNEERSARERLETELRTLLTELQALRRYGERRGAARVTRVSDVRLELLTEGEETLFCGPPHDLSRSGLGLEADRPLPLSESFRVRLQLPGQDRSIQSLGRLIWQEHDPATQRYRGGCRLVDVSPRDRDAIDRAITKTA